MRGLDLAVFLVDDFRLGIRFVALYPNRANVIAICLFLRPVQLAIRLGIKINHRIDIRQIGCSERYLRFGVRYDLILVSTLALDTEFVDTLFSQNTCDAPMLVLFLCSYSALTALNIHDEDAVGGLHTHGAIRARLDVP